MRERPPHSVKPSVRRTTLAVDVVVLSPQADALAALLVRTAPGGRERWSLPWDAPLPGEGLEDAATRITEGALVAAAEWYSLSALPPLSPRHRAIVDRATTVVRQRVDQSPLAFRLLP